MVDGAVLLVDAVEGPLAQTKFVLAKALSRGLAPVVVLNKVDRPAATQARCDAVTSQLFDLFANLGADDSQLDFPVVYASAKQVGSVELQQTGCSTWHCLQGLMGNGLGYNPHLKLRDVSYLNSVHS